MTRFKNNLEFKVDTLCNCQDGVVHSIVASRPYNLIFKTTNWCWNNCPHCCESSGSNQPKKFIPESTIKGYIKQATQDERFTRSVVFTGGEITAAYKFVDTHYLPNIINYALNLGCDVDIKTNAGWVNAPLATKVYSDIENIVKKHAPKTKVKSQIKPEVPFQVSLSLDRFHTNALERDFKFIEHFAKTDIPNALFRIHISSFSMDAGIFDELMFKLQKSGINITPAVRLRENSDLVDIEYLLNNNVIMMFGDSAELFSGGRAKNLKSAYRTPAPQFTFLDEADLSCMIKFDENDYVILGENNGPKIAAIYNDKDGNPYPLQSVLNCLVETAYRAEQHYRKQHFILDKQVLLARKINKFLGK